ncbi:MAG: hypothetical protein K9K67_03615 [Bacteriovoracaceae bacterium]|nr:hypothetical protein [Bacteriovoracaceae bacterium]
MKNNRIFLFSALFLLGCGQELSSKRIRPGDILGLQGLESQEFQKLVSEVNSNAPEFVFPKNDDSITVKVIYKREQLREFDSTILANHKCRYSYIEEEITQKAIVTTINAETNYEMELTKTPINPAYTAVPLIKNQKDACDQEINLLTKIEDKKTINFTESRQQFATFINKGLLKLVNGCNGTLKIDNNLCSSLRVIRAEESTTTIPSYSLTLELTTISPQGDKTAHDLFMEVSPKLAYFYPYGVFNLIGYFPVATELSNDHESIEFYDTNL